MNTSTAEGDAVPHQKETTGDVSVACRGGEFFNTTHLTGDALTAAIRDAKHQDAVILAIYRAAGTPLSPSEVWRRCAAAGKRWPLTSVRRAITNLTNAGGLCRLASKRRGEYGRLEYEWQVAA